jgi:ABC-type phosphate transport system substrate-binding protein
MITLLSACACTSGADPDPVAIRRNMLLDGRLQTQKEPELRAESVALGTPAAPAPGVESSTRQLQSPAQTIPVALGREAALWFDREMQAAFAAANPDWNVATSTSLEREALARLTAGEAECALYSGTLTSRDLHAGLQQVRIGAELYALVVADDFPARNLTRSQMRQALTGEVQDWQQLGYTTGPVLVIVPADRSAADRAARALILGDNFHTSFFRLSDEAQVYSRVQHTRGAIGIVKVTGARPKPPPGLRYMLVDWMAPTAANLRTGSYPHGQPMQLVTVGAPNAEARKLQHFFASPEGRDLLARHLVEP